MSSILTDLTQIMLLAQGDGGGGAADGAAGDGGGGGGGLFDPYFFLVIMAVMVLFYFMVARPQRQKQKDVQSMLDNLKENDEVVTVGGIVGTVVSFSKQGKELVLRTDEKSSGRLWAVRTHSGRRRSVEEEAETEA